MQKTKWSQTLGLPNRSKNSTFSQSVTLSQNVTLFQKKVLQFGVMHCIRNQLLGPEIKLWPIIFSSSSRYRPSCSM